MLDNNYLKHAIVLLEDIASKDRVPKTQETQLTESIDYIKQAIKEVQELDLKLIADHDHIKYIGRTKSTLSLVKGNLYPIISKNDTEYLIIVDETKVINIPLEEATEVKRLCVIGFKSIECILANPGYKLYDSAGNYIVYSSDDKGIVKIIDGKETPLIINKFFKDSIWYLEPINQFKGLKGLLKVLSIFNK